MARNKLRFDIDAKDRTKQAFGRIGRSLNGLRKSIFSVKGALIGLGAGMVGKSFIKTATDVENLRLRFKFLFKSAKEGGRAFDELTKFAAKVPFSLEQIAQGSGNLAVVTKDADELAKMLEITGNVAAVTGLDFRTTAEQIQRSFGAGIGAADLFRDRGVRALMGFQAGAKVTIEDTKKRFFELFGKGGAFGNAADEMADTFTGTLSMLGDKWFTFQMKTVESAFFDTLKKKFGNLNVFLDTHKKKIDDIAESFGVGLANGLEKITRGMVGAVNIGKELMPTIEKIGSLLKSMVDGFMALPPFIREVGLVGAFILGKKGAAALAGISLLMDKITDFINDTKVKVGIFDKNSIEDVENRIKQISITQGEILRAQSTGLIVNEKAIIQADELWHLSQEHLDILTKEKAELEQQLYWMKWKNVHQLNALKTYDLSKEKIAEETEAIKKAAEEQNAIWEQQELARFRKLKVQQRKRLQSQHDQAVAMEADRIKRIREQEMAEAHRRKQMIEDGQKLLKKNQEDTLAILSTSSKRAFKAFKAWKISEAIIDAIGAFNKALNSGYPPPLNFALAASSLAMGFAKVSAIRSQTYSGRAEGGPVSAEKAYRVGERGPEMFVPGQDGYIVPNESGRMINVNFTINAVDTSNFQELLQNERGLIIGMINSAVNQKGRSSII